MIELERRLLQEGWVPEARDNWQEATTHWISPDGEERLTNMDVYERYSKTNTIDGTCEEAS